jgi:hypothetical protein
MSDSSEVLKKADALLGRYGRGTRAAAEPDFPVLTEIVEPGRAITSAEPQVPGTAEPSPDDRSELASRIAEELRTAIAVGLADTLGEPLRERLEAYLHAAVEAVSGQIQHDLEDMVQDAVAEAVERVLQGMQERSPGRGSG